MTLLIQLSLCFACRSRHVHVLFKCCSIFWWHDRPTREPNMYNAILLLENATIGPQARLKRSSIFYISSPPSSFSGLFSPTSSFSSSVSAVHSTQRYYSIMESPIFSIPVPIDVEPFLQAADTNLKEVKRPPNCFMIFRSEVINNWPSSLGLRPKDITKSSKLLLPTWNALRDSEEGNPWKLFSRRVAEEHKVRFPEYKYKPGAKQEAKDTQKAIKQEGRKVHAASGLKKRNSLSSRVTIPNDIPTCGEGPYIFPSQSELPSQAPVIFNTPCPPTRSEDGALGGEDINGWKPWQQGEDYSNDSTDRYEHNEYYREELAEAVSFENMYLTDVLLIYLCVAIKSCKQSTCGHARGCRYIPRHRGHNLFQPTRPCKPWRRAVPQLHR